MPVAAGVATLYDKFCDDGVRRAREFIEILPVVAVDVPAMTVHARGQDAEVLGFRDAGTQPRAQDRDVLLGVVRGPHAPEDFREERVRRAVDVFEDIRAVDALLPLRVLEDEPVRTLGLDGRQLEEISRQDELDAAEEFVVARAQDPRDLVELPEELRVEHRHLVEDEDVRAAPALARLIPHALEEVPRGFLRQSHTAPPMERRAAD